MNLRNINDNGRAKLIQKKIEELNSEYSFLKEELDEIKYKRITNINDEYNKALDRISAIHIKDLREIQSKCNHKWVEDGRDSHKTYYACSICGIDSSD